MLQSVPQDHGLADALDQRADPPRPAGDPATASTSRSTCRSATSTAPSARCSATRSPRRGRATACPTARSTSASPARPGRASGRSCPAGVTLRLIGDANDYLGKGLSGGRIVVAPAADVAVRRRGADHRRQRHRLRRDGRRDLPARRRRRALLRAQLGRPRRRRGHRRPRLRVHDRRPRRRARPRPGATSAPACRAASPTCSTSTAASAAGSTRRWSRSRSSTPTTARSSHDVVTRHRELTGSAVADRLLASWAASVSRFRKVMPTDYKRVLTVMKQAEADGLDEDATHAPGDGGRAVGEATGFLKWIARAADAAAGAGAAARLEGGLRGLPGRRACRRRPGAAWTAASRSATTAARSAT